MKNIIVNILITAIMIGLYHIYLTKQGIFDQHIKGVYTVNIAEVLDGLKKELITQMINGETKEINVEEKLTNIEKSLEKISQAIPEGYLMLPDSVVLGGKRYEINLLTGEISQKQFLDKGILTKDISQNLDNSKK